MTRELCDKSEISCLSSLLTDINQFNEFHLGVCEKFMCRDPDSTTYTQTNFTLLMLPDDERRVSRSRSLNPYRNSLSVLSSMWSQASYIR